MGANSKIEWTHHTFNPWIGCSKVHAGCEHCYAEALSKRTGKSQWGTQKQGGTRVKTTDAYWRQPLKWNREAACLETFDCANGDHSDCCPQKNRPRVFCASLADVFEDWDGPILAPGKEPVYLSQDGRASSDPDNRATLDDLRKDLFALIDATPNLDWLLLTKRPENIGRMWTLPANGRDPGDPLYARRENVWLGTSVSNQETLAGASELVKCRDLSPVLFLSAEPLVGPIDLPLCFHSSDDPNQYDHSSCAPIPDWVIVGGESGPGARPMHPDWARQIRDQCVAAGVPFFFKQWGEFAPVPMEHKDARGIPVRDVPGPLAVPIKRVTKSVILRRDGTRSDTMPGDHQPDAWWMVPVGKQDAGHLLDGVEWQFFPHAARAAQHAVSRGAAEIAE